MTTNYIISPAVFYWINVLSTLQTVFAVIGGFMLGGFIVLFTVYAVKQYGLSEPEKPDDEESRYDMQRYLRETRCYQEELRDLRMLRKYMLIFLTVGGILVTMAVFIPGKQTSVEMLVARTATFDNVEWTVQQVKEIIDYIVYALKETVG